jgi:aminocarboxymuconate-semialdehyde decarboxylase
MIHGIDIHTHIVPERFPAYAGSGRNVPWPSMAHDGCGHAQVMISGKNYRTVSFASWSTAERVKDMDGMHIARQTLSPMPELLSYWLPLADAQVMCRHLNDTIAGMIAAAPARFSGLGAVPLQDVDAAVAELEFIVMELKLSGVEIGSHVSGVSIGDPRFDPFFSAVETWGAAVFVHALRPAGKDRLIGPAQLEQVVAFPGDIGLAAASLVTGGMLERHPKLRVALSHGGGAFAMMLPRLEHGWKAAPAIREAIPRAPSEYARRLWCDTLVYDPHSLRHVLRTFGDDRVMIGTDYPFAIRDTDPHASIDAISPDAALAAALREGNARRFLGLDA